MSDVKRYERSGPGLSEAGKKATVLRNRENKFLTRLDRRKLENRIP